MTEKRDDPSTTSGDYEAMAPYWRLVDTFMGGVTAMRAAGETYLPKFEAEREEHYRDRLKVARFTNIYGDLIEGLSAKPFAEELKLDETGAESRMLELAQNIDGRGSSLHVFAGATFHAGLHRAVDWILVDFTKATLPDTGRPLSVDEEKMQGLRPYWVHIPATAMIRVRSDWVGGKEIFTHAAWKEDAVVADGFAEKTLKRIRVMHREPIFRGSDIKPAAYAPATYRLYEEREGLNGTQKEWVVIDEGPISLGEIPITPFATGRRIGASWRFEPPMRGAADLQIELYQAENNLKWTATRTAFPMLNASGVTPEKEGGKVKRLAIGPGAVLYGPPSPSGTGHPGAWSYIEPAGSSLTFLSGEIGLDEKRMRELGRQPLTAESGNLTVVTTAFAAQKGNTAIEAWALNLTVALERAWKLTAKWLKVDAEPKILWNLQDLDLTADDKGLDAILKMRATKDLTRETGWKEMKRRNVLSPDFDPDAENEALDQEAQDNIAHEADLIAATTPDLAADPTKPTNQPGAPPKDQAA